MRNVFPAILCLALSACNGSGLGIGEFPRMANLHWYVGGWESEDGTARQFLTPISGGYRGELYFRDGETWVLASSGQCVSREVPLDGWHVIAPVWNCDYTAEDGFDMGFDRLAQSAYVASSYNPPGLPSFGDGSIFVNRAFQGDTETLTYEHWTRPNTRSFRYQLWQMNEAGDPEPWFSGVWLRIDGEAPNAQ